MAKRIINRIHELQRPPAKYPRRFVPDQVDFSSWENLEPLYEKLIDRNLTSVEEVERWLLDWSELGAVVSEEGSRRYIAMTCATDDKDIEIAFLYFVENIKPKTKPFNHRLQVKLLDSPLAAELDERRYEVMLRGIRASVELFRDENIAIETEVDKLSQQYQKAMGAMTVEYKGKEYTMQQMGVFGKDPDRSVRKEAWELATNRRLSEHEKLDEIFDKMLELRNQIAKNAGFDNFRDYQFRNYHRFDYTPGDCFKYHDAVEKFVVPVAVKSLQDHRDALKLDTVRPWDTACDRFGRQPLRPFEDIETLVDGCRRIFSQVDNRLGDNFQKMIDMGLLDLDSRKGKAPGGYQSSLNEVRLPFIFMNAVGLNNDVFTLLHEGGHAFHQFAVSDEPLLGYRHAPMEFCEVASMGMEKLAAPYLDEFYSPGEAARACRDTFEGNIGLMPWIAVVDAFQHWIYTNPGHTSAERSKYFASLMERFSVGVDWTGLDSALQFRWQAQLHIFQVPFYYIEYGIALLGALQIWQNSKRDLKGTVDKYLHALSLGGSRPLPDLFEAAGVKFDFSESTIRPLMEEVQAEIEIQGKLERQPSG